MNREIKFRGKRIDNGEWVYGFYVEDVWGHTIFGVPEPNMPIKADRVDPETIGQYTGLKDKNEKEGAFNDIVKFTYIYSKGYGKEIKEYYTGEIKENKFFHSCIMVGDREFHIDNLKNGEIIENIHENKELIK